METKTRKDELLLSAPTCMLCAQLRPEEQLVMLGLSELLQPTISQRVTLLAKPRKADPPQKFPTRGDDVLMDLPLRLIKSSGHHYERILRTLQLMEGHAVTLTAGRGKGRREVTMQMPRVDEWMLPQYERTVRLAVPKRLVLAMVNLRGGYARVSRGTLAHLRAPHTRQMYFLLKRWAGKGGVEISYRHLRQVLGLPPDTEEGWKVFKRNYLKRPQDDLAAKMQRGASEMAFTFAARPASRGDRTLAFYVDCPKAAAQAREDTATQSCIGLCGHLLRQMKFDDGEVDRLLALLDKDNVWRAAEMLNDVLARVERHQVDHVRMYVNACMAKIARP